MALQVEQETMTGDEAHSAVHHGAYAATLWSRWERSATHKETALLILTWCTWPRKWEKRV